MQSKLLVTLTSICSDGFLDAVTAFSLPSQMISSSDESEWRSPTRSYVVPQCTSLVVLCGFDENKFRLEFVTLPAAELSNITVVLPFFVTPLTAGLSPSSVCQTNRVPLMLMFSSLTYRGDMLSSCATISSSSF